MLTKPAWIGRDVVSETRLSIRRRQSLTHPLMPTLTCCSDENYSQKTVYQEKERFLTVMLVVVED